MHAPYGDKVANKQNKKVTNYTLPLQEESFWLLVFRNTAKKDEASRSLIHLKFKSTS